MNNLKYIFFPDIDSFFRFFSLKLFVWGKLLVFLRRFYTNGTGQNYNGHNKNPVRMKSTQ